MTPLRFEQGDAMLMAGIRRQHRFADAPRTIAAQWSEFNAMTPFADVVDPFRYGILCGAQPELQIMEYMTAVRVANFEHVSEHIGRLRVPAQRYAVFLHDGPMHEVHVTWNAVWNEWLPQSGLVGSYTPEFERYAPTFNFASGAGELEIWAAVVGG